MIKNKKVIFQDLALIDYQKAWDFQEEVFSKIVQTKVDNRSLETAHELTSNYLLLCEHPHVYTLGKSGKPENLLVNSQQLIDIADSYKPAAYSYSSFQSVLFNKCETFKVNIIKNLLDI